MTRCHGVSVLPTVCAFLRGARGVGGLKSEVGSKPVRPRDSCSRLSKALEVWLKAGGPTDDETQLTTLKWSWKGFNGVGKARQPQALLFLAVCGSPR